MAAKKRVYHRVDITVHEDKKDDPEISYESAYRSLRAQKPEAQMAFCREILAALDDPDQKIISGQISSLAGRSDIRNFGTGAATELIFKLGLFLALQECRPAAAVKQEGPLPEAV